MLKMLQSYRALVEALIEAKKIKNKDYENAISKCIENLKPEMDKFMQWLDDDWLKKFIYLYYLKACNKAQYEVEIGNSNYNSMRLQCIRVCKKYDKIGGKKL